MVILFDLTIKVKIIGMLKHFTNFDRDLEAKNKYNYSSSDVGFLNFSVVFCILCL